MTLRHRIVISTLCLPIMGLSVHAQSGRAVLAGTLTDSQGVPLQGVRISVDPGGATALTDATGQFSLVGLNPGTFNVTAAYAGFQNLSKSVTLSAGQIARLDSSLSVASNVQNVQVYAGREGGELEAINRTINADNIINVLPAEVITSLPNANIADALGRLPSVTLERDEGEGKVCADSRHGTPTE